MPSPEPSVKSKPAHRLDASTRLLYAIVCLRAVMGLFFLALGYIHWDDHALVQELTSQWIDWTANSPLFWLQDLFHWLIIPNAWFFARLQTLIELVAGVSVTLGLFHQWGIQLVLVWVAIHLLLVAHLQLPYLNAALLGMLLVAGILWLADAGRWLGLDNHLAKIRWQKVMGQAVTPDVSTL
jgi:hypothetical protein